MAKIIRYLAAVLGVGALLLLAGIGYYLVADHISYRKAEITTELINSGRYDPRDHFSFDKACVYPPESTFSGELTQRGYQQVDAIFPESHIHWSLVLIDDHHKTFRVLYAQNTRVLLGGEIICARRIVLRTKNDNATIRVEVLADNSQMGDK